MPKSRLCSIVVAIVLVSACGASTTSPIPTDRGAPHPTTSTAPRVSSSPVPSASPLASQPPAAGATWELAGPTPAKLRDPHAVLLGDARVLLVGNDYDTEEVRAFLWDPGAAGWTETNSLNARRSQFAMVPLSDGRALVTGGLNDKGQSFSSTYIFDPSQERWSKVGLLGTARTAPSAAVLNDGRVLLIGGYFAHAPSYGLDSDPGIALAAYRQTSSAGRGSLGDVDPPNVGAALATAEIFDPASGQWSATGPLRYARAGASAVTLADGRVLIAGSSAEGVTVDGGSFDDAEVYDPGTGRFSLAGRLPPIDTKALEAQGAKGANPIPDDSAPYGSGRLVALDDGGAVLIAQQDWWKHVGEITRSFRFDARTAAWKEIGKTYIFIGEPSRVALDTPGVRAMSGVITARLGDGRVLIAGGTGANDYPTTGFNETHASAVAEAFDPSTEESSPLPPMPEARDGGLAVALRDGSILVIGGSQESATLRFVPAK